MISGYSRIDHDEYVTHFQNRWMLMHGVGHRHSVDLCMRTFHFEYDGAWPALMEAFENWIVENDLRLEATKPSQV